MVKARELALDTNIAIAILNGDKNIIDQLGSVEIFYLPITVCGELLYGAKNSLRKEENLSANWQLIEQCEVLNVNVLIADEYSTIRQELKDKGKPIPENDIWIAAICRSNEIPLATRDKHLSYVNGLEVISFD